MDRFGTYGDYADPQLMPEHLRALHRKQMAALRAEREARFKAGRDENGRLWPGLVSHDAREALDDIRQQHHDH